MNKKPSCNTGWLRLMVHIIFGTLIVASFILIVLMSFKDNNKPSRGPLRCGIDNCKVICKEAPYFGHYKEDILLTTMEAATRCNKVALELNKPYFVNSTMPENWLNDFMRANVRQLHIIGGNLGYITPKSFKNSYGNNIRILHLENIKIINWNKFTFSGLINLNRLTIKNCHLDNVEENALQAVESTIKYLKIEVPHFWDPVNVTGTSNPFELVEVNFSYNSLFNNLNNETFTNIPACKVLHLDHCKINFIGAGTFDHLPNLEQLYLNNNWLVTLPVGIFNKINTQIIQIALHINFWLCDCSRYDMKTLTSKGILIEDPTCRYPDEVHDVRFSDFYKYCGTNGFIHNVSRSFRTNVSYSCQSSKVVFISSNTCDNVNHFLNNEITKVRQLNSSDICIANRIKGNIRNEIERTYSDEARDETKWLKPIFFTKHDKHNMLEIAISVNQDNGVLWYQSSCNNEVYCINIVPDVLKLYNIDVYTDYTFCPFNITSGKVHFRKCLTYNLTDYEIDQVSWREYRRFILYACLSLVCLSGGAILVYALIHRHPTLLRGNKRVLLVKHKNIDALILPPEVKSRASIFENDTDLENSKNNIYVVTQSKCNLTSQSLLRSQSMRSNESNDASYISALQPTEEQLIEWRFNQISRCINESPITDFSVLPFPNVCESTQSTPYHSIISYDGKFESTK